jgi:multidrug efflux pump subunit AcrB
VTDFFLRRPIFASVASLVVLLLGLISIPILPIAQYPNIAPPTVTVSAEYTGASAEAVEASVTTPLEQAINGVQGLRYISSRAAATAARRSRARSTWTAASTRPRTTCRTRSTSRSGGSRTKSS